MNRSKKIKKIIFLFLIFILLINFLFVLKVEALGGGGGGGGGTIQPQPPRCPSYRPVSYEAIPSALASYILSDRTAAGSIVLQNYLAKVGYIGYGYNVNIFQEILNPLGGDVRNARNFTSPLQPDAPPPNHKRVTRVSSTFFILATTSISAIDLNGDGRNDYQAKGSLLYLHKIDPNIVTLIYKPPSEVDIEKSHVVQVEIFDLAEEIPCSDGGPNGPGGFIPYVRASDHWQGSDGDSQPVYKLFFVDRSVGSDRKLYSSVEGQLIKMSNIIFNISVPECRRWTDKGLFTNVEHLECRMDALAFNGQIGNGYIHKAVPQKNLLGFILVILFGLFLAYFAPFYLPITLELAIPLFYVGNIIALGWTLAAVLTTSSFATINAIAQNATFGTTDNPAGGLEQFGWSCPYNGQPGFCPGFGGVTTPPPPPPPPPPPEPPPPADLSVTSLDIRTFICKNRNFDLSFLNEYLSRNPNYQFAPSTTYATQFYNEVAKDTCPESQRNRPVEFSAKGECVSFTRTCPPSKLIIEINSDSPPRDKETKTFETAYNSSYPKSLKEEYIFNKPYDYRVTACLVDQNGQPINDINPNNNCKTQTVRIFDYMCVFGFCSQMQRDIDNPSSVFDFEPLKYRILQTFGTHDLPCRYYRNEICRARFGF